MPSIHNNDYHSIPVVRETDGDGKTDFFKQTVYDDSQHSAGDPFLDVTRHAASETSGNNSSTYAKSPDCVLLTIETGGDKAVPTFKELKVSQASSATRKKVRNFDSMVFSYVSRYRIKTINI